MVKNGKFLIGAGLVAVVLVGSYFLNVGGLKGEMSRGAGSNKSATSPVGRCIGEKLFSNDSVSQPAFTYSDFKTFYGQFKNELANSNCDYIFHAYERTDNREDVKFVCNAKSIVFNDSDEMGINCQSSVDDKVYVRGGLIDYANLLDVGYAKKYTQKFLKTRELPYISISRSATSIGSLQIGTY